MAYEFVEEKKPSSGIASKGARLGAQVAKEVGTTVAGFPGDMFSLINSVVAAPIYESLSGKSASKYEDTYLGKAFPTSAKQRETLEQNIPYLKPEGKLEKFVGDIAGDAASLLMPSKHKLPFQRTLTRALTASVGANVVGAGMESFGGDKDKAAYSKLGSLFLLSTLNPKGVTKLGADLRNEAARHLPEGATVSTGGLFKSLDKLKSKILQGREVSHLAPSEKFIVDEIEKVLHVSSAGITPVETLSSVKRSLNEQMQGLFASIPEKVARQRARKLAPLIGKEIRKTLKDYGNTNKNWWDAFRAADEVYGVAAQSNFINNFISNISPNPAFSHAAAAVIPAVGGIGSLGAYPVAKMAYRAAKSPTIRKHYINVLKGAAEQDASMVSREMNKINKEIEREKKSSGYIFVK